MKILAQKLDEVINEFNNSSLIQELDWDHQPGIGKWSAKQIIGHLIDSANINIQRFMRSIYEEGFKICYHQNEWVEHQHYDKADTREVIQLWTLMNRQIVRILENYPPDRLHIRSDTARDQPEIMTLEEIAEDYIVHLLHHLEQIKTIAALHSDPKVSAK